MNAPLTRLGLLAAAAATLAGLAAAQSVTTSTDGTTTTTSLTLPGRGASAPAPTLGAGLDTAGMDRAVRPQDDLFAAMNGAWVKSTEIPADKSTWGSFVQLRDRSDQALKAIVEALPASKPAPGTNARKVADWYGAFVDTAAIDAAGLAPVRASLKEVDALRDAHGLAALMGRWQGVVSLPLAVDTGADFMNPGVEVATLRQSGLGLPDRDYYLKDDPRFTAARAAYATYLERLFTLDGDRDAKAHAQAVVDLEKQLAQAQWPREQLREPRKAYNPMAPEQLAAQAPGLDWPAFVAGAQLPATATIVVRQPSYATAVAALVKSAPLATWQWYLRAHRLDGVATVLPQAFRDASFAYRDQALRGLQQPLPRWQQAVNAMDRVLGEATGELYVAKNFPPAAKARAQELVANLMKAYAQSIDGLAWMSPATKVAAHEKLSKYTVKIGYPDRWRDYSALEVRAGDALGNADRADAFEYRRRIVRVGGPVDRSEWHMSPQTVNAYYNGTGNEIVFPAAILQPPFFNVAADDAVNYGGIGAVIGHEISHGFDDQGSQFDGDGRLRNWWTDADRAAFEAVTSRLVAQYHAYEPLPGHPLNGKLTLGENIADLSGLQIAYKAYELSLEGKKSPVIDGWTGEQRFFLGWSQVWREKTREQRTLESVVTNPHSPGRFRADGAAVNADGFHAAFDTKPGDGMWKAPADRIRLW